MKISAYASCLSPSLTLAMAAKAKAMQADGIQVVNLGVGEPDFDTPDFIKAVAIEDLHKGVTKYTASRGTPDLLKAISEALQRDYGLEYSPGEIIVSNGGKHSLYNAFRAMCDPGDEVIIPAPYWLSYPEQVRSCGAVPVILRCPPENDLKLTPAQLRAAITPRTVAAVINSPSNPSGVVYSREELLALGEVLLEFPHVTLISDDLYQRLVYAPAAFHSIPAMLPELRPRTLIVNGWSKAYSMTGWRMGWAAGPADLINAMDSLQSHSTSNPVAFCQRAAAVALRSDHRFLGPWLEEFDARRRYVVGALRAMPDVRLNPEPLGAFYAFPDVSAHYGRTLGGRVVKDSMSFCEALLEVGHVAAVPGAVFGEDRCIRMSYATSMKALEQAMERLGELLG
jgi:aspartate aminotransferase